MKYLVYIFLSFFIIKAHSQITVTSDDLLDVGDSVTLAATETAPAGFAPGPSGANQHWDFSTIIADTTNQINFVDPANTPYASSFPTSNIAVEGMFEEAWAYTTKNSFIFQIDGLAGSYDIFEDIAAQFEPPEVMFSFPVNYLDSLEQTSTIQLVIPSPEPPADSVRVKVVTSVDSKVDSWGELTTPVWTGDVLRFKEVRITIDTIWVKLIGFWIYLESGSDISVTYKYMANDVGYPVMQFNSDTSGTEYSLIKYLLNTGIGLTDPSMAKGFEYEIYPNPAGAVLNARWSDRQSGTYSLSDMFGRKVKQQDFYNLNEIKLQTSDLPKGLYILHVGFEGKKDFISERVLISH